MSLLSEENEFFLI